MTEREVESIYCFCRGIWVIGQDDCTSVVHAPNGTTKVECCLYLQLTYLTILGTVSCVLEHSLGIMFVLLLTNL